MVELVYGNAYCRNTEQISIQSHEELQEYDENSMRSVALDFLETVEDCYRDEHYRLPDDWFDTIFYEIHS